MADRSRGRPRGLGRGKRASGYYQPPESRHAARGHPSPPAGPSAGPSAYPSINPLSGPVASLSLDPLAGSSSGPIASLNPELQPGSSLRASTSAPLPVIYV